MTGVRLSTRVGYPMPFDSRSNPTVKLRPEIELAWRRAELFGLDPGMDVQAAVADFDKHTRLSAAASPVLDKMVDELADTRFAILLADRTSRIIDRRASSAAVECALDRVLAIPGFQYLEELSGTNSLATAFELRQPIAVTGEEHFLEALRPFCGYGVPIFHPMTHRLEGVIDVSGPVADATTLLGPFLTRAARDIEERLLERARVAEKQLLAEFQVHGNNRHAVVVLGESMVLSNTAAVDLVKGEDHVALRAIAADLSSQAVHERGIVLSSNVEVTVRARRVAGTRGGAVFEFVGASRPIGSQPASSRAALRTTAVIGEPGTGRTSTATTLAGPQCAVFDCADSIEDESRWFVTVRAALEAAKPLVIDNIDALSARLAASLSSPVPASRTQIVLTCVPLSELQGPHRALASLALTRHELQPLRSYPHRLARVVKTLLAELVPNSSLEIAPSALQLLAVHSWPGNLRELRSVLEFAARERERGIITESDLPEAFRSHAKPLRPLTLMESVERAAIVSALRAANGNKAAAAADLGIGRTTLYERLRRYGIVEVPARPGVRNQDSA